MPARRDGSGACGFAMGSTRGVIWTSVVSCPTIVRPHIQVKIRAKARGLQPALFRPAFCNHCSMGRALIGPPFAPGRRLPSLPYHIAPDGKQRRPKPTFCRVGCAGTAKGFVKSLENSSSAPESRSLRGRLTSSPLFKCRPLPFCAETSRSTELLGKLKAAGYQCDSWISCQLFFNA